MDIMTDGAISRGLDSSKEKGKETLTRPLLLLEETGEMYFDLCQTA